MNKKDIVFDLMNELHQTVIDNNVDTSNESLFEFVYDNIKNEDYLKSDLSFATLCNVIGYLQGKIVYMKK